ncbi:DUF5655 domain-containing protein [Pontibacter mangrovi]|uniref:DUF5655 domain-containing protein n=1 Tax=Pontibacter mangrovi TaxID=2589816 RepID=UPI001EF0CE4F|nr:DUF5655 domain-containing protein [Pontibacter mangrovi]
MFPGKNRKTLRDHPVPKKEHGLTHGYANLVAHKSKGADAGAAANPDALIGRQYAGKEQPRYNKLLDEVTKLGEDIEITPKNSYVRVRRKKQFATFKPATKTRFDIGLHLSGQEPLGKLVPEKPNAMCSHKINLTDINGIDKEVIGWIKAAYDKAGLLPLPGLKAAGFLGYPAPAAVSLPGGNNLPGRLLFDGNGCVHIPVEGVPLGASPGPAGELQARVSLPAS